MFIGAPTLTNVEFGTITLIGTNYDADSYSALLAVLDSRETISSTRTRLTNYYLARGASVIESVAGKSNIFIGAPLCD